MNSNLTLQKQVQKTYGDGIRFVTVEQYSTWAFKVLELFMDSMGKERGVWIVLAGFYWVRFIDDRCYIHDDKSTSNQSRTHPRENDVSLVQISFFDSASKLDDHRIIAVKALQKIDTG